MGICAHKRDQEEDNPPSFSLLPQFSENPGDLQLLVDITKASQVPLLSLANNPLYLRRIEEMKGTDDKSKVTMSLGQAFIVPNPAIAVEKAQ